MPFKAELALITLIAPLAAFFLLGIVYPLRRSGKPAALVSISAVTISLVCSVWSLVLMWQNPSQFRADYQWLPSASGPLAYVGFWLDPIAAVMLVVVTAVALAVQVYSLGYLHHETPRALGRYYTYHSLFCFAMLGLVLANNFLELFIFWELVGLCSYLLIGFWYYKPEAARAAVKAFWVTRFGDIGLIIGVVLLWGTTRTFDYNQTFELIKNGSLPQSFVTLTALLIFAGAVGKSAQFPLHIWLPDAMEGPTPVSALIHAATMVAAGVYLVTRLFPVFQAAPSVLMLIAYLGSFTAFLAATLATRQSDLKRVLAYSTVSQLGFMMAALGAGALVAGYFHLFTHAFFKALLFLGAGCLIHATGNNNLSAMGNLASKMKWTTTLFLAGGLSLAGIFPFSGFFSKDEIVVEVAHSGLIIPLVLLLLTTFLTGFYIFRAIFLALWGPKPAVARVTDEPDGPEVTEPKVMIFPMVPLAVMALIAGFGGHQFGRFLAGGSEIVEPSAGSILPFIALGLAILGIGAAYIFCQKARPVPKLLNRAHQPLAVAIDRKYWLDDLYDYLYWNGLDLISKIVGWIDRYLVDGIVNLTAWATGKAGELLSPLQTGKAQDYLIAICLGVLVLVIWVLGIH